MEYMPNMAYGPRVAAQHEDPLNPGRSVNRNPVPGTVPRGFTPYRLAQEDTVAAMRELSNPLPRTADVLGRGQRVFLNTCVVCHGELGDGQGYIVPIYPMPPSLLSEKVRAWPDSRIFHIISRGQNLMPSYASQILPEDRWAAVHYVRALQRAAHPTPADDPRLALRSGVCHRPGPHHHKRRPLPGLHTAPAEFRHGSEGRHRPGELSSRSRRRHTRPRPRFTS